MNADPRILVHRPDGGRTPADPRDFYLLEAEGGGTLIRLRSSIRLVDVRPLGDLMPLLAPYGFVRIHRSYAVNRARIRDIRLRPDTGRWELRLDPPVNSILPVGRTRVNSLWAAFGERV